MVFGRFKEGRCPSTVYSLTTIHASEVAASEIGHCDQAPESMEEAVNTPVRRKSGSRGLGRCGLGNPRLPLAEWLE